MDMYVIRHAEAVSRDDKQYDDDDRPLTDVGREQARNLAKALVAQGIQFESVVSSPLIRARQTAEEMLQNMPGPMAALEYCDHLAPGGKARKLSRSLLGIGGESVAIIGHEPDLSNFIGRLIGCREMQLSLAKGGVAKVQCDGVPDKGLGRLVWLLTPEWIEPRASESA